MLHTNTLARLSAGLLLLSFFQAAPAAAQENIIATAEDATRVHIAFVTMDLLMHRCGTETGQPELMETAHAKWVRQNQKVLELADVMLKHFEVTVSEADLRPRAEGDVEALLTSLVTPAELCDSFVTRIDAGIMDLVEQVPDMVYRLSKSVQIIRTGG